MDHPKGARETDDGRLGFDRRVRLEFRGTQLSSDGGLLVMRELDDVLGLSDLASSALNDSRLHTDVRLNGRKMLDLRAWLGDLVDHRHVTWGMPA